MAIFFTAETTGIDAATPLKSGSAGYAQKTFVYQANINLATVNGGAAVTTSDQILLARVPAGYKFLYGILTSTVTLGTSVIAIGTNQVHASNGQYRAAAVSTAVNTPALFDVVTTGSGAPTLTADGNNIWLTVATASLPTTGLVNIALFYAKA